MYSIYGKNCNFTSKRESLYESQILRGTALNTVSATMRSGRSLTEDAEGLIEDMLISKFIEK